MSALHVDLRGAKLLPELRRRLVAAQLTRDALAYERRAKEARALADELQGEGLRVGGFHAGFPIDAEFDWLKVAKRCVAKPEAHHRNARLPRHKLSPHGPLVVFVLGLTFVHLALQARSWRSPRVAHHRRLSTAQPAEVAA